MNLVAFVIAVTIAASEDYDVTVDSLRTTARMWGCPTPVIERLTAPGQATQRMMVTCREVLSHGRDNRDRN